MEKYPEKNPKKNPKYIWIFLDGRSVHFDF